MYNINPLRRLCSISKRVSYVHHTLEQYSAFICLYYGFDTNIQENIPLQHGACFLPLLGRRKEYTFGSPALGPTSGRDDQSVNTSVSSLYCRDLGLDPSKSNVSLREQIFTTAVQHTPIFYRHL